MALFTNQAKDGEISPFPLSEDVAKTLEADGNWSLFADDGEFLGAVGVSAITSHRGLIWAMFNNARPGNSVGIHRATRYIVEEALSKFKRIEAYIDVNYAPGHRAMKTLGFHLETKEKPFYLPDGRTISEYVRFARK